MSAIRCPQCKKVALRSSHFFPFCSERCKMLDLGAWLDGRYRISRSVEAGDLDLEELDSPGSPLSPEGSPGTPDHGQP